MKNLSQYITESKKDFGILGRVKGDKVDEISKAIYKIAPSECEDDVHYSDKDDETMVCIDCMANEKDIKAFCDKYGLQYVIKGIDL